MKFLTDCVAIAGKAMLGQVVITAGLALVILGLALCVQIIHMVVAIIP